MLMKKKLLSISIVPLEGTKVDIMKREMKATFEMDCNHELQYYEDRGYCTMAYESVIGRGKNKNIYLKMKKWRL